MVVFDAREKNVRNPNVGKIGVHYEIPLLLLDYLGKNGIDEIIGKCLRIDEKNWK